MREKGKIKSLVLVATVCFSMALGKPAHAYVWPTIDITMITSFVSSINSCIGQVKAAKAQIDTYIQTIDAVGDQASSIVKYAMKLKNSLSSMQDKVNRFTHTINPLEPLGQAFDNIEQGIGSSIVADHNSTNTVLADIKNQIQNQDNQNNIHQTLAASRTKILKQNTQTDQMLNDAQKSMQTFFDDSEESLDKLVSMVVKDGELNETSTKEIQSEHKVVKNSIRSLKTDTLQYIALLKDKNAKDKEAAIAAYDKYEQDIQDYRAGRINEQQMDASENAFKEGITSKLNLDSNVKDSLLKRAEKVTLQLNNLKESLIDKIANNKEYSDEEPDKTSSINKSENQKYVFNYSQTHNHIYLKGIYANQKPIKIEGGDKNFIFSRELWGNKGGKCKELDFSKIEDNIDTFLESFRDCVIRAKTEKDYFCNGGDCDPYEKEPAFKKFKREGVYKHIVQDYAVANELNIVATKQEMMSWQQSKDKNPDSTLVKLQELSETSVSNTLDAYTLQGMIGLEYAKLWSRLRRVDALARAESITNLYRQQNNLYIDGRDEDFAQAQDECPGLVKDGETNKTVISNAILYGCQKKGTDFSVEYKDRGNEDKVKKAETNIKECFKTYADGTSARKEGQNIEEEIEKWRIKEQKALNDSAFYTLALATINTYKSSKDFDEKAQEANPNIVTLEEGVNKITTLMDSYNSGLETSYYTTQQILNIVDTDAQNLQTEIIKDLKTMSADFFGEENN